MRIERRVGVEVGVDEGQVIGLAVVLHRQLVITV